MDYAILCNGELLIYIHKTKITLRIKGTAVMKTTNMRGHLSGYGWVRFCPRGIASILSMSRVREIQSHF